LDGPAELRLRSMARLREVDPPQREAARVGQKETPRVGPSGQKPRSEQDPESEEAVTEHPPAAAPAHLFALRAPQERRRLRDGRLSRLQVTLHVQTITSCSKRTPEALKTASLTASMSRRTSSHVAPPRLMKKFAWTSETAARPTASPFRPAASI